MPSWLGITNVALNGTDLDFTSTASAEGGFNGSVDLSSLSVGVGTLNTEGLMASAGSVNLANEGLKFIGKDGIAVYAGQNNANEIEIEAAALVPTDGSRSMDGGYTPSNAQDVATKQYVDSQSGGIQETTGSWTPIVGTTDPADFVISSYQIQQGHWVRHGNLVTVDFTIQALASNVSAASGSTSALFIHGWPFDALGAGSSIQAPFLDFVDGFDVEVKSTTINTTNDPAIIGGLRLLLMKQHPGVTNYVAFQNLYAGEFTNGNYFRIFGSMTYYTTNTTLNTGATQLP